MAEFLNITQECLAEEHLCCIIRTKSLHPGVEAKRRWLSERLREGHVFRKLKVKGTVFIEYAPLESAWVPIEGERYIYIYCLWVLGEYRKKGYGTALLQYCIEDAKAKGMTGICMLGAKKQKAWLSDQRFAKKFGFRCVDATENGYELLALSFDGSKPFFAPQAKQCCIADERLTIYYDMQCPFIFQTITTLKEYCAAEGIAASFLPVDTLEKAKRLPGVFNNWALFYKGRLQTVNLLSIAQLKKLLQG